MTRVLNAWHETRFDYDKVFLRVYVYFLQFKTYLTNTVEHLIVSCVFYLILCVLLYLCIIKWKILRFDRDPKHAKRILFVIAHPDDEVMFFGPTITHYTKMDECTVFLVCLSTGRNYGMGNIRIEELYKSCKILGIKDENIFVHNHTHLPDAMDVRWPPEIVSNIIANVVHALDITNIITFDRYGVSNHLNHCSIYYAIANLILERKLPKNCDVYVLESVNIFRKYWLFLDIPLSYVLSRIRYMEGFDGRKKIHRAMYEHKSQIVWFRRLYMYFSRYMLINTLQKMSLVDIELDLEIDD